MFELGLSKKFLPSSVLKKMYLQTINAFDQRPKPHVPMRSGWGRGFASRSPVPKLVSLIKKSECLGLVCVAKASQNLLQIEVFIGEGG